jgi:hypothetical protein
VSLDVEFEATMARFDEAARVIDARLSRAEATYCSGAPEGKERQPHDQRDRVSVGRAEILHVRRFWTDRQSEIGNKQL